MLVKERHRSRTATNIGKHHCCVDKENVEKKENVTSVPLSLLRPWINSGQTVYTLFSPDIGQY